MALSLYSPQPASAFLSKLTQGSSWVRMHRLMTVPSPTEQSNSERYEQLDLTGTEGTESDQDELEIMRKKSDAAWQSYKRPIFESRREVADLAWRQPTLSRSFLHSLLPSPPCSPPLPGSSWASQPPSLLSRAARSCRRATPKSVQ